MPVDYLHNHPQFADLVRIVSLEIGVAPALVEKDYWIMHSLFGLQQLGLKFELKGGTSLSKGHKIINRFSEDIDIRIEPPADQGVKTGRNQRKPAHIASRLGFYDWLAATISIPGVVKVERDTAFDTKDGFSGGIRLRYSEIAEKMDGLKEGVLLEAGFDDVTPNIPNDISSWAFDRAVRTIALADNRAKGVSCYDCRYTFVEKLQTISTKFRLQQQSGTFPVNFMRHYYDAYSLLRHPDVQAFVGTNDYKAHKQKRFRQGDNADLTQNQAFVLADPKVRAEYARAYTASTALYYADKPTFDQILEMISAWTDRL